MEKLKQDAAEINSRKEQLAAEMKEIKATQTELEAKKAKVNKLREQRAYMLYKAQEEEQSSQEEYERLLAISENIASMLRNMETQAAVLLQDKAVQVSLCGLVTVRLPPTMVGERIRFSVQPSTIAVWILRLIRERRFTLLTAARLFTAVGLEATATA